MELDKAICDRRSIRSFTKEIPDDEVINKALEPVCHVPSPVNSQSLELVVIKSAKKREELETILVNEYEYLVNFFKVNGELKTARIVKSYWRFISSMLEAPVIIAAGIKKYNELSKMFNRNSDNVNPKEMYIGASLYSISLKAHSMGLGTCIYTAPISLIREKEVLNNILNCNVYAFITLGYPNETPEPILRKGINEMVKYI